MGKPGVLIDTASRLIVMVIVVGFGLAILTTGLSKGSTGGVVVGAVVSLLGAYRCINLVYWARQDLTRQKPMTD